MENHLTQFTGNKDQELYFFRKFELNESDITRINEWELNGLFSLNERR